MIIKRNGVLWEDVRPDGERGLVMIIMRRGVIYERMSCLMDRERNCYDHHEKRGDI